MNKSSTLTTQQGLASLVRPRFYPGLLLEDEDLTAGVDYTRNMMRLLFRSLFGCGVICGLDVGAELICEGRKLSVSVARGVALDCLGDPIEVPRAQTLVYDPDCKPLPSEVWVTVCYLEKCCRPRETGCSADDDGQVRQTRAYDGFEIRLYDQQPECACSCEPPAPPGTPPGDACCDEHAGVAAAAAAAAGAVADRTDGGKKPDPCACYKDHMAGICECDCGCTCVVIGKIKIDPCNDNVEKRVIVDASLRRLIRPVLIGYLECLKRHPGANRESAFSID